MTLNRHLVKMQCIRNGKSKQWYGIEKGHLCLPRVVDNSVSFEFVSSVISRPPKMRERDQKPIERNSEIDRLGRPSEERSESRTAGGKRQRRKWQLCIGFRFSATERVDMVGADSEIVGASSYVIYPSFVYPSSTLMNNFKALVFLIEKKTLFYFILSSRLYHPNTVGCLVKS